MSTCQLAFAVGMVSSGTCSRKARCVWKTADWSVQAYMQESGSCQALCHAQSCNAAGQLAMKLHSVSFAIAGCIRVESRRGGQGHLVEDQTSTVPPHSGNVQQLKPGCTALAALCSTGKTSQHLLQLGLSLSCHSIFPYLCSALLKYSLTLAKLGNSLSHSSHDSHNAVWRSTWFGE